MSNILVVPLFATFCYYFTELPTVAVVLAYQTGRIHLYKVLLVNSKFTFSPKKEFISASTFIKIL